jgi:hypothetical protein
LEAGWNAEVERMFGEEGIMLLLSKFEPWTFQPIVNYYTDSKAKGNSIQRKLLSVLKIITEKPRRVEPFFRLFQTVILP